MDSSQRQLEHLRALLEKQLQLLDRFGEKPDVLKKIAELEADIASLPSEVLAEEKRQHLLASLQTSLETFTHQRYMSLEADGDDLWQALVELNQRDRATLTKIELTILDLMIEAQTIGLTEDDTQITALIAQDMESIPLIRCKGDLQEAVKKYVSEIPDISVETLSAELPLWNKNSATLTEAQAKIVACYRVLLKKGYAQARIDETIRTALK